MAPSYKRVLVIDPRYRIRPGYDSAGCGLLFADRGSASWPM